MMSLDEQNSLFLLFMVRRLDDADVVHSVDLTHRDDRVGVLGPAVDAVVLVPLVVVFRAVERVGTGTRRVQPAKNHPDLELIPNFVYNTNVSVWMLIPGSNRYFPA